jgi:hypothetical protein
VENKKSEKRKRKSERKISKGMLIQAVLSAEKLFSQMKRRGSTESGKRSFAMAGESGTFV